jgi:hypothetical protein
MRAGLCQGCPGIAPVSGTDERRQSCVDMSSPRCLFPWLPGVSWSVALGKTETKTVRGLNVVGVVEKANNETLYVATEGEPYPVQVQSDTGQGALDFLDWNEPVDVQAPPPDQVVDLSKFTGARRG